MERMREYQSKKSTIIKIIESAGNVAEIKSALKDQEDIRRTLSKHEVVKNKMSGEQEELDDFTSKGKQLLNDLKKIQGCDPMIVREDMDAIMDQWLDSEVESKEHSLKTLNVKVSELKQITKSQEPPTELQVIEASLRKKIGHAQEMSEIARRTLRDFSSQKQQLESFISQMTAWLSNAELSLSSSPHSTDLEDLRKVKV
ncbi:UNVERIFIED_CONTAM: hypothetical protein FKN15_064318 [Acipenser sinensis]